MTGSPPCQPEILDLVDGVVPGDPVLDTSVSHALLRRVASAGAGEALRLYVPEAAVLFSLLDARRPGFAKAVALARDAGFGAVLRLAGGHAAVFTERTLAFSWARPSEDARRFTTRRFEEMLEIALEALQDLGVDARAGEVTGEYCPGAHSVNAGGRTKLMGVGQRVIRGGAHVGGVLVVDDTERIRDVLVPVYEALGLEWRPDTTGSVADEIGLVTAGEVRAAFVSAFERRRSVRPAALDAPLVEAAESLRSFHDPEASPRGAGARPDGAKGVAADGVEPGDGERRR